MKLADRLVFGLVIATVAWSFIALAMGWVRLPQ